MQEKMQPSNDASRAMQTPAGSSQSKPVTLSSGAKATREGALPPPKAKGVRQPPKVTREGRLGPIQAKQRPVVKGKALTPPAIHIVKVGDTYSALAQQYEVTIEQLRAWNGFPDRAIPVGAQLLVSDPNDLTEKEIQDYFNRFDLEDYLRQIGMSPQTDPSPDSKATPKTNTTDQRRSPSGLGAIHLGKGDFFGKVFYNQKGQISVNIPDNPIVGKRNVPINSGSSAGAGLIGVNDYAKRRKYIAKVTRTANEYLKQFDTKVTNWGKLQVMNEAVDTRNENRPKARKGLSWGGKRLSEAIDQDRSLKELFLKYKAQNPNMSHEELARLITQKSGTTSRALLKFNRFSKIGGPVGTAVGAGLAAYAIYEDPTLETTMGEVTSILAGASGFTLGMGLVAMGLSAVGVVPLAVIGGAALGGVALGMLTAHVGKAIGRQLGKWLDSLF